MSKEFVGIVETRSQYVMNHMLLAALTRFGQLRGVELDLRIFSCLPRDLDGALVEGLEASEQVTSDFFNLDGENHPTGYLMDRFEQELMKRRPKCVLAYGASTAALAGALVAAKLNIPLVHIEAGVRLPTRKDPDNINYLLIDQIAKLRFTSSARGLENLEAECLAQGSCQVGDLILDYTLEYQKEIDEGAIPKDLHCAENDFYLAQIGHRENLGNQEKLRSILTGLAAIAHDKPVLLPCSQALRERLIWFAGCPNIVLMDPLPILSTTRLLKTAALVLTDDADWQREAAFLRTPCLTLRTETPWPETVSEGWNILVGASVERIEQGVRDFLETAPRDSGSDFGDGHAADRMAALMMRDL